MSSIKQEGRKAIESLEECDGDVGRLPPFVHDRKSVAALIGRCEIYLLGVSRGVGSCAEKWGKNVLVFGEEPNNRNPEFLFEYGGGKIEGEVRGVMASYSVLLLSRTPTSEEIAKAGIDGVCAPSCQCFERLAFKEYQEDNGLEWPRSEFRFSRTGKTAAFVALA